METAGSFKLEVATPEERQQLKTHYDLCRAEALHLDKLSEALKPYEAGNKEHLGAIRGYVEQAYRHPNATPGSLEMAIDKSVEAETSNYRGEITYFERFFMGDLGKGIAYEQAVSHTQNTTNAYMMADVLEKKYPPSSWELGDRQRRRQELDNLRNSDPSYERNLEQNLVLKWGSETGQRKAIFDYDRHSARSNPRDEADGIRTLLEDYYEVYSNLGMAREIQKKNRGYWDQTAEAQTSSQSSRQNTAAVAAVTRQSSRRSLSR